MGSRSPETQIKRARELALKEQRERKQAKKDARAVEKRRELEEGPLDAADLDDSVGVDGDLDLAQPVGVDVVDEAAHALAVRQEGGALARAGSTGARRRRDR